MKKISLLVAPLAAVTLFASYGCSKVNYKVTEEEFSKALKMECEYIQFDGSLSMTTTIFMPIKVDTTMKGELSPTVSHIITTEANEYTGSTYLEMFVEKTNESTYKGIQRESDKGTYTPMDATTAAASFTTPEMLPTMFFFPSLESIPYNQYTYDEKTCLYTGVIKSPVEAQPDTTISLKFKNKQLIEIHQNSGDTFSMDASFTYDKTIPAIPWPKQNIK